VAPGLSGAALAAALVLAPAPPAAASLAPAPVEQGASQRAAVAESRAARGEAILERCRVHVDALLAAGSAPGVSVAIVLDDGTELAFATGLASREEERPLAIGDRLLSGSIGKTYVAAAIHRLVAAGELELEAEVAPWFADDPWFERLPNARQLTLRNLLQHTAGLPRYVFEPAFWETLLEEKDKVWRPEEQLAYVLDTEPPFPAGEGWSYADTNYLVAGMVFERVSGRSIYDYVREHLLEPHGLDDTVPSDRRRIPGLVQGYAITSRAFGVPERVLDESGAMVFNPQFEWCGGGFASTPLDLARWARVLYGGRAFEGDYLETMLRTVPAPALGPGAEYGLGVIVRDTAAGRVLGHDGFMPGYTSSMGYLPDSGVALAVQTNCDDREALGRSTAELLVELASIVRSGVAEREGGR